MHILIMAQHFAPEEVSGAVLATELALDLVQRGHRVTFLTCAPSYPQGVVFPGYRNALLLREDYQGVQVVRTWSYITPSKAFWPRILNYGTFSAGVLLGGFVIPRPDVILSASPPLPLGVSAYLLSRRWGTPWVLRVEDLFPDAAVSAGVLKNRLAVRFFYALEKFLYRKASHISLISEAFQRKLQEKGVPDDKMSVFPVWADADAIPPLPRANRFSGTHGLDGKFVVMYAGNLGLTSALEDVLAAAELLREQQDVQFVIVGEGVKKPALQEQARRQGLDNVLFLPFQPRAELAEMLASADAGLVTLNLDSSNTSLPSKIFTIMSSGRPAIAVASHDSEIARLVEAAHCGLVTPPGQPEQFARVVLRLRDDPCMRQRLGENGRSKLVQEFSRERCVTAYENTLLSAYSRQHAKEIHHA